MRSRSGISPWRGKRAIRPCAFSLRQCITGAVVRKYGGVFFLQKCGDLRQLNASEVRRVLAVAAGQFRSSRRSDSTCIFRPACSH
ncbi:hypothetical protein C6Q35_10535 [Burkholderia multivorans]|nr:hypothetical protein C6Q35_10535 [Burkholderia multivorans]